MAGATPNELYNGLSDGNRITVGQIRNAKTRGFQYEMLFKEESAKVRLGIVQLYMGGLSERTISALVDLSHSRVSAILVKEGAKVIIPRGARRP